MIHLICVPPFVNPHGKAFEVLFRGGIRAKIYCRLGLVWVLGIGIVIKIRRMVVSLFGCLCLPVCVSFECPFIPTDSGMARTIDQQKSMQPKTVHGCVSVGIAHSQTPHLECVRMMACVICASRWEASHCIACVTASTSMVRLEVVIRWAGLTVLLGPSVTCLLPVYTPFLL